MNGLSKDFLDSLEELAPGVNDFLGELPPTFTVNADARSLNRVLALVQAYNESVKKGGTVKWFDPHGPYPIESCPKHKIFFASGADYPNRLFMAANRVGKSIGGAFESSCHATGIYPEWWEGKVFDHPTKGWAIGPDAKTVRDTIQLELVGPPGEEGTGMIPANLLGKFSALQGTTGAIDTLMIKHLSGGWSRIAFKNYKQDISSFMGTSQHWIWPDEECPIEIWNECNMRTMTTGGIMYGTFTPLQGLTRMVINFCKQADFLAGARPIVAVAQDADDEEWDEEGGEELVGRNLRKAVIQAGWNDAPWLDAESKARLLEDTPEHLKKARSEGIPSMGAGAVFTTPIENVLCDPFVIPDSWPRMYGLDVGWNRTAAVWGAMDPNSDTIYLYDEHYQGEQEPHHHAFAIKARGDWIRGAIDPASRGRGQADGNKLLRNYKDLGLRLMEAKNQRESGIMHMNQRFSTGRAKVFKTLVNFQREYILYRRKLNGTIEDEDDHAIDAARYIFNNMERMSSRSESKRSGGIKYVPTVYRI